MSARAEVRRLQQIVVVRVVRAVADGEAIGERPLIVGVDGADVARGFGHGGERRGVAAFVAVQAVRHAELILMTGRAARDVIAGEDPRAQVALIERGLDGPVAMPADGRAEREEGHAARAFELQQLARRVEHAGRQQVDLPLQRRMGEERPGHARGRLQRRDRATAANR